LYRYGAGGAIPADCILREGKPLQVDQAALTVGLYKLNAVDP
jgi:magnesium-transporting ATPase (P-type)